MLPLIEVVSKPKYSECVALAWSFAEKEKIECHTEKNAQLKILQDRLQKSSCFSAKKGEICFLRYFPWLGAESLLLVGLGERSKLDLEIYRRVGAALLLGQKKEKIQFLTLDAKSFWGQWKGEKAAEALGAFCEGYFLAGYEYRDLKTKSKEDKESNATLEIHGVDEKSAKAAVAHARILCEAVNFARHLGDRPANYLTPEIFGQLVNQMAKSRDLKVKILGRKDLEKEKMGLFLGVAQGSVHEPKLIVVEYLKGKKGDKPIALIGKGITFDSGGISLKPSARMEDMKYDMMGAAAVTGMMQAISDLKLSVNVVGFLATSENMPNGNAQKPGDVQKSLSGKTVEIINTDAEGRLVLADTIEYAQKHYAPQAILDFATLTGSVVDALGSVTTGVMGTGKALLDRVRASSEKTGERVWELPIYEEYEEDLKSDYADIKNIGIREAGASKAGAFLKFFVDKKIPWVHCDIAGSSYHRKDVPYHPKKYGAGVMVRLVSHLLERWEPLK